jgi:hypothetical protein
MFCYDFEIVINFQNKTQNMANFIQFFKFIFIQDIYLKKLHIGATIKK